MDLKEIEAKVASLEALLADRDERIKTLTNENKAQAEQLKASMDAYTSIDKELTIIKANAEAEKQKAREQAEKSDADTVMAECLADTSLSTNLHEKVRKMVDYTKFKTETGEFDKEAFRAAFSEEVKDWEGKTSSDSSTPGLKEGLEIGVKKIGTKYSDENKRLAESIQ